MFFMLSGYIKVGKKLMDDIEAIEKYFYLKYESSKYKLFFNCKMHFPT